MTGVQPGCRAVVRLPGRGDGCDVLEIGAESSFAVEDVEYPQIGVLDPFRHHGSSQRLARHRPAVGESGALGLFSQCLRREQRVRHHRRQEGVRADAGGHIGAAEERVEQAPDLPLVAADRDESHGVRVERELHWDRGRRCVLERLLRT